MNNTPLSPLAARIATASGATCGIDCINPENGRLSWRMMRKAMGLAETEGEDTKTQRPA